jgi:hypothetical protein
MLNWRCAAGREQRQVEQLVALVVVHHRHDDALFLVALDAGRQGLHDLEDGLLLGRASGAM